MYKVVWVARFKEGTDSDVARRHWSETHGPLGRKVPGIERYVQNHVTSALGFVGLSDERASFDGYSTCWYAHRSAFEESLTTPAWGAIGADSPNLFDDSCWAGWSASLDPRTIIDGPEGPFKTVWFVRFKPEVRADPQRTRDAHDRWITSHGGQFGVQVPGISRYVQNHVVAAIDSVGQNDEIPMEYDGYSECWFEDRAAFDLAMASEQWRRMNEDAVELFDIEYTVPLMSAVLAERVIVEGTRVG